MKSYAKIARIERISYPPQKRLAMLTLKQQKLEKVRMYLTHVCCYVELCKVEGLLDSSIELEEFSRGLLNILFGLELVDLNKSEYKNFPAIDLGDQKNKCSFQISSDDSKLKIVDSLKAFDKHNLAPRFGNIKFLIYSFRKKKPQGFGDYSFFSPESGILYTTDIFNELVANEAILDSALQYFENNIRTLDKVKLTQESIEFILFKQLFSLISDSGLVTIEQPSLDTLPSDDSDLKKKKSRFSQFWSLIESNYMDMMTAKKEKTYSEAERVFSESELISLRQYLRLASRKCLFDCNDDPIKGIELLRDRLIEKFAIGFVSEAEVEYFLYYQLYYCFIFPN